MKAMTVRSLLLASLLSFAIGLTFAVRAWTTRSAVGGLAVESKTQNLGAAEVDVERICGFRITNSGSRTVRLLGATSYCTDSFCVRVVNLPDLLAPNGGITLNVGVKPRKPGSIQAEFTIFSDDEKTPRLDLAVVSNATEPTKGK